METTFQGLGVIGFVAQHEDRVEDRCKDSQHVE